MLLTSRQRRAAIRVAIVIGALALILGAAWFLLSQESQEEPVARSYEDIVWLRKEVVTLTATGAAGAAQGSGSTDRDLGGYVYALHLDFTAGISTTTDITLTQASPALTVLQLSDYYTDTWYYPVVQQHGSDGAVVTAYEKTLVQDALDITVGETTSGTVGTVTVYWGQ